MGKHRDGRPGDDDDDAWGMQGARGPEGPEAGVRRLAAIAPRPGCDLQRPQGEGYEVQVAETCHEENATQLITHVEVTPSSGSDTRRERAGR